MTDTTTERAKTGHHFAVNHVHGAQRCVYCGIHASNIQSTFRCMSAPRRPEAAATVAPDAATAKRVSAPTLKFTLAQAQALVESFGGEEAEQAVSRVDGVLRAWCVEYPEEGSVELVPADTTASDAASGDYVLVPRNPTPEMLEAACCAVDRNLGREPFARLWRDVLAAAPEGTREKGGRG